jgi:hypothetical protein
LIGIFIAPAAAFYEQSDLKTLFVLSKDVAFDEREGIGSARLPAGPSAAPSGPVMRGPELPSEVAPWLDGLAANDRAILYVLHGPRGLDLTRFPVEKLAALTNACECGSLIVVLDLPAPDCSPAWAPASTATGSRSTRRAHRSSARICTRQCWALATVTLMAA